MENIIETIDSIIEKLSEELPCNPNSKQNIKLADRMEKDLIDYFDAMSKAFPYQDLERIYSKNIKESIEGDTGKVMDPILTTLNAALKVKMAGHLTTIYVAGSAEMLNWGGLPFEGIPSPEAINWAEKHAAKLVTQMDEETKNRLAQVISDGIANKRGPGGLATDIKRELGWMGRSRPSEIPGKTMQSRAYMISRTETSNALSQASLDRMKEMEIDGKQWITAGDNLVSVECSGNEAEGIIPVDQTFSGGVMAPPQHPNCRCAIAPARLNK
jgi:SPP1 gp7 family putative phage head morphogenesis protein